MIRATLLTLGSRAKDRACDARLDAPVENGLRRAERAETRNHSAFRDSRHLLVGMIGRGLTPPKPCQAVCLNRAPQYSTRRSA